MSGYTHIGHFLTLVEWQKVLCKVPWQVAAGHSGSGTQSMDTLNHSHLTVSMAKGSPWWPIPTVLTHSVACPACTPEHTGGIEHGPLGQVWSNRKDGMWSQIVVPQASQKSASHCVRGGPWGWATRDVLERHGGKDGETHGRKTA